MNYKDCISYINKLYIGKTSTPTLDRMRKVLEVFSYKNKSKVIHVAGTNGKGSTCNMIHEILLNAGYKVGLYTSPHLVNINERIKINDDFISDDDFAKYVSKVIDKIKEINVELLFFELLTVSALLYFEDNACDFIVFETGMGGEYDATNVIENPICTVITNIGLDHEDVLGTGIINIAKAKAGIIKENVDVVLYDINEGKDVFIEKAREKNAKIHLCDFNNISYDIESKTFDYKSHKKLSINLKGEHQIKNACVALETIDILKDKGYKISAENITYGLKNVHWPARFQVLQETNPMIILDGGHNPQCIDSVVKELKKYSDKKIVFVVSVVKDKNVDMMAKLLSSVSKKFVLTHIDNKRALDEEDLKKAFLRYSDDVIYNSDIAESISIAKEKATKDGIVCIIGSLYFAGEVLKLQGMFNNK